MEPPPSSTADSANNAAVAVQIREASQPFDRDDVNLIVRSSDGVDFNVHSLILSFASPVFANILTFPQPPGTDPVRPVVDFLEDSETLDAFLRVLYSVADPDPQSLPLIRKVLAAAAKYDAPAVIASMRRALVRPRVLEYDPLCAFAIACYFGLEAEAAVAAETAVIANRVTGFREELDDISAGAYFRLLQLNRTRKKHASNSKGVESNRVIVNFTGIEPLCEPAKAPEVLPREPLALAEFPFDTFDADIILRSCDAVEFRVSRAIISLASSTMLERILQGAAEGPFCPGEELLPVYPMAEDSVVVDAICYPVPHPALTDLDLLLDVLSASRKYDIARVEQAARDALSAQVA